MNSTKTNNTKEHFYVAAQELGTTGVPLPAWASHQSDPIQLLTNQNQQVTRQEVPAVPGAFQLLNVLSAQECQRIIDATDTLGFQEDAAVSLPRKVRHNNNLVWITDEATDGEIWRRVQHLFADKHDLYAGAQALGINPRFRFYRYEEGDYFKPHTDGSWPGSRVIDKQLVANAYPDRWSQMTFLILLSDEFEGGETEFYVSESDPTQPARSSTDQKKVSVRTPAGGVLCFPHGMHPKHCLHGSALITKGLKYIIRTDVLFEV